MRTAPFLGSIIVFSVSIVNDEFFIRGRALNVPPRKDEPSLRSAPVVQMHDGIFSFFRQKMCISFTFFAFFYKYLSILPLDFYGGGGIM